MKTLTPYKRVEHMSKRDRQRHELLSATMLAAYDLYYKLSRYRRTINPKCVTAAEQLFELLKEEMWSHWGRISGHDKEDQA